MQRVSVDAGFTCPNVDGTVARGGCVFCNNTSFSPSRRLPPVTGPRRSIAEQIDEGIRRLKQRYGDCERFIAYFQPATNTYAPVDQLRRLYEQALAHPDVIGLAIGTRPDCAGDDVLDLLTDLARRTFVSVEYGMQTMHDRSLDWMNRGHHHEATVDAITRSRGRGFEIGVHIILGLPGESREDMQATARELARLNVDAVKLHNLYVVHNTPLAEQVRCGKVRLLGRDEYVRSVVDTIETAATAHGGSAHGRRSAGPVRSGSDLVPGQVGAAAGDRARVRAPGHVSGKNLVRLRRRVRLTNSHLNSAAMGGGLLECAVRVLIGASWHDHVCRRAKPLRARLARRFDSDQQSLYGDLVHCTCPTFTPTGGTS